MVLRYEKKSRKYLGARRWGAGNIKNRRGAGSRGGVGKGGRKHNFTHMVVYEPERLRKKGFSIWNAKKLQETDIGKINAIAEKSSEGKPTIELRGYKVLSDGILSKPVIVKAAAFSKLAEEKIKKAGGEAIKL